MIEKNGKVYYTASNVLDDDIGKGLDTKFMDEVTTYLKNIKDSIRTNKINYFNEYNSAWGSFRTILIPVKSIIKREYIIAADQPIEEIQESLKKAFYESIFGDFIFFFFASP